MATKIFTFPESTSRTQTHTVTISDLVSVSSVTVNTGNVTLQSVNGKNVTIQCSNGAYSRRVQTGGSYTPSDTKTVTRSYIVTGTREFVWDASSQKWLHNNTTWDIPPSQNYNYDGYSGTLYPTGSLYNIPSVSGTTPSSPGSTHGQKTSVIIRATQDYSGSVTKPGSDTRTYQYYYQYTVTIDYVNNALPTLTLDTTNNRTLYENDTLTIAGQATDTDNGNIVNVKYQIDGGTIRPIATTISDGTAIPYSKTLTFKNGKLMDGTTEVTGTLAEGVPHTLKVWAEDDRGGKSVEEIRTFYVVANRAPTLTIDSVASQSGLINNDTITITGSVNDPEKQNVVVKYKIGTGNFVQVYKGPNGAFSFDIKLADLADGDNTVTIQATDSYGYTTKTLKVTKTLNTTTLTESKERYKIQPPTGSAQGIVLWIQRDETLDIAAEISMTMNGEQENFVPMTLSNTAPITDGIVEDEFTFNAGSAKENIVVEIQLTGGIGGIQLISGVLS